MNFGIKTILLVGTFCLGGCFSLETAVSEVTGDTHIMVGNYGWHLFDTFPLMCGNSTPEPERFGPWAWFRDDVTQQNVQDRFLEEAAKYDGELVDLSYWVRENMLYEIPGLQIPLPIPYILTYREIQLSGVIKTGGSK